MIRLIVSVLCFVVILVAGVVPVGASANVTSGITEIPDPQLVLKQVRIVSQTQAEAVIELEFYPEMPLYQLQKDINARQLGQTSFAINFENSRLSPTSSQPRLRGVLRGLQLDAQNRDLRLGLEASAPSRIDIEQISDSGLRLVVERVPQRSGSSFGRFEDPEYPEDDPDFQDESGEEEEFELIRLKFADVSEVVGLLTQGISVKPNNTFIRREPGFGSPGSRGDGGGGGVIEENNEQPLGESVDRNLAINRRLNAIWVRGTREKIEQVKRQIELIDLPVDSVILETEFVELTETGSRNLGVDFTNAAGQIGVVTARSGEFNALDFGDRGLRTSVGLQAALYAQIQKGEGRILSKPRIAAQSGATAKIITGDALPILTAITLSGVNGVSQQVEYVNVGVTLQIAPRVSPDGFVTSKIYTVVSNVTGFSQGFPTISQREAETSASVRDGESFVIGGLVQDSTLSSRSKIPLLGDIPVLGAAFSRETQSRSKTDLYIIITPRIVKYGEDLDGGAEGSGKMLDPLVPAALSPSERKSPPGRAPKLGYANVLD